MTFGQKGIISLATFDPEQILEQTGPHHNEKKFGIDGKAYMVSMASKRYQTFRKSRRCECCGPIGADKLHLGRDRGLDFQT